MTAPPLAASGWMLRRADDSDWTDGRPAFLKAVIFDMILHSFTEV
jgi:hypothetical protein